MTMAQIYAEVDLPYRDPATARELPQQADRQCHGSLLPNRAGVGASGAKSMFSPVRAPVLDGRLLEEASLDQEGYALGILRTALPYEAFFDTQQVLQLYFPEIETLLRQKVPGAEDPRAKILIFDHSVRGPSANSGQAGVKPYSWNVHCDLTCRSGHVRVKDQLLSTNETEVRYGALPDCWGDIRPGYDQQRKLFRAESHDHNSPLGEGGEHLVVNVWKPLRPVTQWPLAVCDARTVDQDDVHPTMLLKFDSSKNRHGPDTQHIIESKTIDVEGNAVGLRASEVLTPLHNPSHRWVVYPNMQEEEALLLKTFDSRRDGRARFCTHVAIQDPHFSADDARESIEVRCLIVLPPVEEPPAKRAKL